MIDTTQENLKYTNPFVSVTLNDPRPSRELLMTTNTLVDLLEKKLGADKVEKDLLSALSDKTKKDKENRFSIQDFTSVCTEALGHMKQQISQTYTQLHNLVSEKQEIERKIEESKRIGKHKRSKSLYNDLLRIKICEVRNLVIPAGEKLFIRISCDDLIFNTKVNEYMTTTFEEASYEFFVKTGLEKLKVEAIIPKSISRSQEEVLGDFEISVSNSRVDTELDSWHILRSRIESGSHCGEVRLSLKMVPLRMEFLKYSTEEVEHKISNQTQEVETLEKSFKNLTAVTSVLKEPSSLTSLPEKSSSSTAYGRKVSATSTMNVMRDSDSIDERGLNGLSAKKVSQEKRRDLPPLAFQHLSNRVDQLTKSSEVNSSSFAQTRMRSVSPGKQTITPRDFTSTPRVEQNEGAQRNSLANLYNLLSTPVKEQGLQMSDARISSAQHGNVSNDWETDRNPESYRLQGSAAKDQASWKKENMRLNGMIRSLQEENKVLLKEVQKLKDTEQKVQECKDKMSVLIGELNRVQDLVREKNEEIVYWKQQSGNNLGFDIKEVQGRIQKLVDENQRLRDIASKAHNESVYYKKQCELYGGNKDKIDSLVKEIEVLRTVNQNLNQEQLERAEYIEELKRENACLKENNKTFSNELAKRDAILVKSKHEEHGYRNNSNIRGSTKSGKFGVDENINTSDQRKNPLFQPLQPWNFLNADKGH